MRLNYSETIEFLYTRLPMFQRKGPAAYKNSLENTFRLDTLYKHPHKKFKTIHVAGTNGKGSVSHMLAAVLQSAGYKTGLYTSPHLKDFRERIRINGKMIPEQTVVDWVGEFIEKNKSWKVEPSFFELTVAMAFDHFAAEQVDIAVVEVGLGGRLDSTNIILPEVSVITNIGLDHTNLLGNTLPAIAAEKAGIIKNSVPVVVGTTQKETAGVFIKRAEEKATTIYFADTEYVINYSMLGTDGKQIVSTERQGKPVYAGLKLDLTGLYQLKNLPAVLKTIELLTNKGWNIQEHDVYSGLQSVVEKTGLLGRWQVIGNNPLIICDTGHNEDGIKANVKQIESIAFKNLHFIFGTVADKNPESVLKLLPKNATYYFVAANIERAMNARVLRETALKLGLVGAAFNSVAEALQTARNNAGKNDFIFVGGSTFVVAEII